jgi:hypothetical protein
VAADADPADPADPDTALAATEPASPASPALVSTALLLAARLAKDPLSPSWPWSFARRATNRASALEALLSTDISVAARPSYHASDGVIIAIPFFLFSSSVRTSPAEQQQSKPRRPVPHR